MYKAGLAYVPWKIKWACLKYSHYYNLITEHKRFGIIPEYQIWSSQGRPRKRDTPWTFEICQLVPSISKFFLHIHVNETVMYDGWSSVALQGNEEDLSALRRDRRRQGYPCRASNSIFHQQKATDITPPANTIYDPDRAEVENATETTKITAKVKFRNMLRLPFLSQKECRTSSLHNYG